jgi:hypothetical protein
VCGGEYVDVWVKHAGGQYYQPGAQLTYPTYTYTLEAVTSYNIIVARSSDVDCDQDIYTGYPVSATINELTPNRNAILNP